MRKIILETTIVSDGLPRSVSVSSLLIEFTAHTSVAAQAKLDNFKQKLVTRENIGGALIYRTIVEVE